MDKIKVLAVFGTRPEAIKMAPLVLKLREYEQIDCRVCVTAQHREMLDMVLDLFKIEPDYDLDIMAPGQTLCGISSKVISGMADVYGDFAPDLVLVHGDTTTAVTAAFSAFYCGAKVGHVEAGLRSFDKYSPYPEEMNRVLISDIADLHFAATPDNKKNLLAENVKEGITITGNTVIDALSYTVREGYEYKNRDVADCLSSCTDKKIILMTAHRRENIGQPFVNIFTAVKNVALKHPEVQFIYPVHPNPNVHNVAHEMLSDVENVLLTSPVDTDDMHNLIKASYLVLTDSGGLQEEAPSLGRPVLVMRTETERPEAVDAGTVKMTGIEQTDIEHDLETLLTDEAVYSKMAHAVNPYGDGNASRRIAEAILHHFGKGEAPKDFR